MNDTYEVKETLVTLISHHHKEESKKWGNIIKNPNARRIYESLIDSPKYKNQLANELKIKYNDVEYYLKIFESLGVVEFTLKIIVKKGVKHKHLYTVKRLLVFAWGYTQEELEDPEFFTKILKNGVKMSSIFFASCIAFLLSGGLRNSEFGDGDLPHPLEISPITYSMIMFLLGILVLYLWKNKRKRQQRNYYNIHYP